MDIAIIILNIIILLAIGLVSLLWEKTLSTYLTEKGKNLATKEDVAEITTKVEEVKSKIQNEQDVEKQKRELKYNAILNSLTLIDANLSHNLQAGEDEKIIKQFATTQEARECHNSLILTCENKEILDLFSKIMFGQKGDCSIKAPTKLLNEYRNQVRKELGFGNELELDEENAWFGYAIFEAEMCKTVKHTPTGLVHKGTKGGTTGCGIDTKNHPEHWVPSSQKITCDSNGCKK